MKKIIPILLLCLVLICCLPMGALKANAAEYTENGWKYTVSNGKATVVGIQSPSLSLTVPSTLGGYPVTTIGSRAFEKQTGMTGITIPDSVTTIESYAFHGLNQLTYVTIGNGVTEIKKFAFYGCSRLKSLTLGESLKTIGENAFSDCITLKTIDFPEKLTEIDDGAFSGCKALTKITFPDSVGYIGTTAFFQCTGLTEVTLGSGVTTVYKGVFSGCTALKTLHVTNSLQVVKEDAFENCTALKNVYHKGDTSKMQQLKNNIVATGNDYLKNATWQHTCALTWVNAKEPTCTTTGKWGYYKCTFCGKCCQRGDGSNTITSIDDFGIIPATGHTLGDWQSNGYIHWKLCSTCHKQVDSKDHSGGTWQSDGTNHWKVCSTCQQKYQTAAHSGGTSTCRSKKQCSTCNAAYGNLGSHSWSKTWDHSDANGHYHKCQTPGCGQLSPVEAHAPGAAATETREQICTVCSYIIAPKLNHQHTLKKYAAVKATCEKNGNAEYYACTGCSKIFKDAGATKEYPDLNSVLILASGHQYTEDWNMNETEHWRACTACGAKDGNGAHIPGAEATDTTDQTCTVCSYVIKKAVAHTHTFSSYWFNDNSAHWKACACGEVNEKSDHADADGDHVCDSCRWALEGDTQETTEATEPENVPEPTEGGNEIPEKNDKQGGISPMVIVVCVLGVLVLAAGTVLVVILVKRKKQ